MDPDPDADPDPSIFIIDLHDANKKRIKKKFFCIVLFDRRIRIHTSYYWIRIRIHEAQKHVYPVDPDPDSDPEH